MGRIDLGFHINNANNIVSQERLFKQESKNSDAFFSQLPKISSKPSQVKFIDNVKNTSVDLKKQSIPTNYGQESLEFAFNSARKSYATSTDQ